MFRLLTTFTLILLTASNLHGTRWIPHTWPFCLVQFLMDAPSMIGVTGLRMVPTVMTHMMIKFIAASGAKGTVSTATLPPIHKVVNLTNTAQHPYIRYMQQYIDPTNMSFPVPGYFKSRQYFSAVTAGTSWFWTHYALCTSHIKCPTLHIMHVCGHGS